MLVEEDPVTRPHLQVVYMISGYSNLSRNTSGLEPSWNARFIIYLVSIAVAGYHQSNVIFRDPVARSAGQCDVMVPKQGHSA